MRIIIDMQGAQAVGTRDRGIGRYTLALSKAMVRLRGEHEVILALNGLFPDTIESIRAAFVELLPSKNISVWQAAGPVNAIDKANDARRKVAEISREAFFASLQPDIVLNTSLFEIVDDSVTSIGSFTNRWPTAVILYDLIPMIFRDIYFTDPVIESCYFNKLDHLRRADLLLSISSSSGKDAIDHLGFPPAKVVNISTACESHFRPFAVEESMYVRLKENYGLVRPFVMYTGGIDHRKNIEGLIRAYASLPEHIRKEHQLVVVCAIQQTDKQRLLQLAVQEGLKADEFVITGFVSEKDLLALYNSCKLFVFPSWYEGFGIPALEAMSCGRAVIGSKTSGILEVIGREDALFDPFDDKAIARKIGEVLTNDNYRIELEHHGLIQAKEFSWEKTAHRAWQALEAFLTQRPQVTSASVSSTITRRPRLAYISPLPPEQSGIADYSAELLPELVRHYDIEVIVAQKEVSDPWVRANCPIRDVRWFRSNARSFDRIIYHFGNSVFHSHMFDLLREFPGVVVLHDFFLSGIVSHMDAYGIRPYSWYQELQAHGWSALQACHQRNDISGAAWAYPCNLQVLQQAHGVIVHSEYSRQLVRKWYGSDAADNLAVIPHLRLPAVKIDRHTARRALGIKEDDFIVCSFGMLGPHKLNHRLLSAWLASSLANDPHCRLVFVGQNHKGDYGVELVGHISASRASGRIKITGRVDATMYQTWLVAADVGVQLRALSRGETSGAVLDCMNYGLATIVNAHGSTADLPADGVWSLRDDFSDEELIEAMTLLWRDASRRLVIGGRAHDIILTSHQPQRCAQQYAQAIENYYQKAIFSSVPVLVKAIANVEPSLQADDWMCVSKALVNNFPPRPRHKQLFLDISELIQRDVKSGIQRVVRALLQELLLNPPQGWIVEPVYATANTPGYRYARRFTCKFLGIYDGWAQDELVDAYPSDIFLGLDLQPVIVPAQKDYLLDWHRRGVKIFFVVYDLLPVLFRQFFPEGAQATYQRWLESISHFDGLVCISRSVADESEEWHKDHGPKRLRPFKIDWFHLGADIGNSVPTRGLPDDAHRVFEELERRPTFLTVGTIEPRKGQDQVLGAFELLWGQGVDANLVIVGKQGWMVEQLVSRIRDHVELGKRLFWLSSISDEYLEQIYGASTCLIAASEGEGFGLPLIEAAQHKLPIIARDIPVFREVAGEHVFYFRGLEPQNLAQALDNWLKLKAEGQAPQSTNMPWLTWRQSTQQLLQVILPEE